MVVSDKTVFLVHEMRKYFWQRPGERKLCRTIKYPVKMNAWGRISNDGFDRIVYFKNDLTSSFLYNNIYRYAVFQQLGNTSAEVNIGTYKKTMNPEILLNLVLNGKRNRVKT